MISASQIQEITSLYKRHGWSLSRVLLTQKSKANLADSIETLFGGTEIVSSEIDAVWFSRVSGVEREAWEIRHLSATPFALLEIFDADDEEEIRAERRHEIEMQLQERITRQ
jgi:hypothetical protein